MGTLMNEKELAKRGALVAVQELRAEIADLFKRYPGLEKLDQDEKRRQTMLKKYGTTNPVEAGEVAEKKAAKMKAAKDPNAPKKSHHKKKVAAIGEAVGAAAGAAAAEAQAVGQTEAEAGSESGPGSVEVNAPAALSVEAIV